MLALYMNISVTNKAWLKMSEIMRQSKNKFGFIYSATAGGCNGYSFKLGLLHESENSKISSMKYLTILNESETDIYIDPLSEMYLLGTTIDYVNEDYTKGQLESKFVFEVDKDLMSSCGCGISFSPKVN